METLVESRADKGLEKQETRVEARLMMLMMSTITIAPGPTCRRFRSSQSTLSPRPGPVYHQGRSQLALPSRLQRADVDDDQDDGDGSSSDRRMRIHQEPMLESAAAHIRMLLMRLNWQSVSIES